MFVTQNQIYVFFACVVIGGAGGVLFSIAAGIKHFLKNGILRALPDVAGFAVFSAAYIRAAYVMGFPSFRPYMALGAIAGIIMYMKSFHILLALYAEKLYNNTVIRIFTRVKKEKAEGKNVGKCKRKIRVARCGGGHGGKRREYRRGNGSGSAV